ncbi:MAG: MBL fold metallo-hydrolase [Armatimonadetes bacterium]|nr:MBL fold metallo-hydrolase [Armatimonadota bacterium]
MTTPIRIVVGELETNCYLVETSQGLLVVDPGAEADRILRTIQRQCHEAVQAVLLTHGHFDHSGAANGLADALGAPVLANAADEALLAGRVSIFGLRTPPVQVTLFHGDRVPMDLDIEVIPAPGHTPGSVVYVTDQGAFVGDTLFAGGVGRTDLPGGDEEALIQSLRTLLQRLDLNQPIYPGHGPPTTLAQELKINPWVQEAAEEL